MESFTFPHYAGALVTFRNQVTVIGGEYTGTTEVYSNSSWNWDTIPIISYKHAASMEGFTSLVINDSLYIFGMIT